PGQLLEPWPMTAESKAQQQADDAVVIVLQRGFKLFAAGQGNGRHSLDYRWSLKAQILRRRMLESRRNRGAANQLPQLRQRDLVGDVIERQNNDRTFEISLRHFVITTGQRATNSLQASTVRRRWRRQRSLTQISTHLKTWTTWLCHHGLENPRSQERTMRFRSCVLSATMLFAVTPGFAADQTVPGAGNANAAALAHRSPLVRSAFHFLLDQASRPKDAKLRKETLDAIGNPHTCVTHRAKLTDAKKDAIVQPLITQGLLNPTDAAGIQGGAKAGVFPPVLNENTACPQLPQPFFSAPGSAFPFGHHSYPGGLPVHESNNDVADVNLANEYRAVYGHTGRAGFPTIDEDDLGTQTRRDHDVDIFIDEDIILGAPIWHAWAKSIVFQWNADGSEVTELNFGGSGVNDNFGAPGDSRTGGHHIIGAAEAMSRGLSPAFVITQTCAHSAPTSGNEYKVVNW